MTDTLSAVVASRHRGGEDGQGIGEADGPRGGGRGAVRIRELGPDDAEVLDAVFAGLSAESRYRRFHAPINHLTAGTRESLAAVDGRDHVALAAFADHRPIGIVRIIALGDRRAELAVEVVDEWHGRGIGTSLLCTARERATRVGHEELIAEVLAENLAVQAVLRKVFPMSRARRNGLELTITMTLPPAESFSVGSLGEQAA